MRPEEDDRSRSIRNLERNLQPLAAFSDSGSFAEGKTAAAALPRPAAASANQLAATGATGCGGGEDDEVGTLNLITPKKWTQEADWKDGAPPGLANLA